MKRILIPAALAVLLLNAVPAQARITVAECKADYDAMIAEIEHNREHSLAELNQQLRFAANDDTINALNHQIEQVYHMEEVFLGTAANAYRDCMKHAQNKGS